LRNGTCNSELELLTTDRSFAMLLADLLYMFVAQFFGFFFDVLRTGSGA